MEHIHQIVKFLNRGMGTVFNRMVADFIRGNSGRLFLFNIKAYRVESPLSEMRMKVKITHRGE